MMMMMMVVMIMMAIGMWMWMWMIIIPLCTKLCVVVVVDGVRKIWLFRNIESNNNNSKTASI